MDYGSHVRGRQVLSAYPALPAFLLLLVILSPVQAQTQLVVTSSADYGPRIAPDSIITIFGSNLAPEPTSLPQGTIQLPTELAGTAVRIDGKPAGLFFVSPNQINCVVPADANLGEVPLEVSVSSASAIFRSSVFLSKVAPAIFVLDSNTWEGAILNGVTGKRGPFLVETPENTGADQRTRLSIFGTGFRLAGWTGKTNKPNSSTAEYVTLMVRDSEGRQHELDVEYAGPAPGFPGLDQINAVISDTLDAKGWVSLSIAAEGIVSNTVSFFVRASNPPVISAVSPSSGPPGTVIEIRGDGFPSVSSGESRTQLLGTLPSGETFTWAPLAPSEAGLRFILPPFQLVGGEWYEGPISLCAEVDGKRSCTDNTFVVQRALRSNLPRGRLLSEMTIQMVEQSLSRLQQEGPFASQNWDSIRQATLQDLESMLSAIAQGLNYPVTMRNPEGKTITGHITPEMIDQFESLLLASRVSNVVTNRSKDYNSGPRNTSGCLSAAESDAESIKQRYDGVRSTQDNLVWITLGAVATIGISACVGSTAGCLPAAVAAMSGTMPTAVSLYTAFAWGLFIEQMRIEAWPNFLGSLEVQIDGLPQQSLRMETMEEKSFLLNGNFVPRRLERQLALVLAKTVAEGVSKLFGPFGQTPAGKSIEGWMAGLIVDKLLSMGIDTAIPDLLTAPSFRSIPLSSQSVSNSSTRAVNISLPCGSLTGRITALAPTAEFGESIMFTADRGNLLHICIANCSTPLSVTVKEKIGIQDLSFDKPLDRVIGGESIGVTITLTAPAPPEGLIVRISTTGPISSAESIVINAGEQITRFSVATQPVVIRADASLTVSAPRNGISSNIVLLPAQEGRYLADMSLSSASIVGGLSLSGSIRLHEPAPVGGLTIIARSSRATAMLDRTHIAIGAGLISGGFTIRTQHVSSPEEVIITVSFGSDTISKILTVTPNTSSIGTIELDSYSITGGDTLFGTVFLAQPAAQNVIVQLETSDPSVVLPQASTVVGENQVSGRFSISTYSVTRLQTVTITARSGSSSASVKLQVNPPGIVQIADLTLAESTVISGNIVRLFVRLTEAAPQTGVSIQVSSSNTGLLPNSSGNISGGQIMGEIRVHSNFLELGRPPVPVVLTASTSGSQRSVTVTIVPSPTLPTLTVAKAGSGTGTVVSNPSGINCAADCLSQGFISSGTVQLTAAAASGSAFTGWTGDCQGSGLSTSIVMSGNMSCTATFTSNNSPSCVNVAGVWDTVANESKGEIYIDQPGCSISGRIFENPLAGSVSGSSITFDRASPFLMNCGGGGGGPGFQTYTGTISAGGSSIVGQFLHPTCGWWPWTATRR